MNEDSASDVPTPLLQRLDDADQDYTVEWGTGDLYGEAAERIRELERENAELKTLLRPFAKYACDEPCNCHNCRARAALSREEPGEEER